MCPPTDESDDYVSAGVTFLHVLLNIPETFKLRAQPWEKERSAGEVRGCSSGTQCARRWIPHPMSPNNHAVWANQSRSLPTWAHIQNISAISIVFRPSHYLFPSSVLLRREAGKPTANNSDENHDLIGSRCGGITSTSSFLRKRTQANMWAFASRSHEIIAWPQSSGDLPNQITETRSPGGEKDPD